jgi:predicted TIM-barrel fold metal-dependent hydrolase
MTKFATYPNVYVKYSGLTSYLPPQTSPEHLTESLLSILPWVQKIVQLFGTERIIWGSDWPVSDINRVSDTGNWAIWRQTSQMLLEQCNLTSSQVEDIFYNNAVRIYHL